MAIIQEYNRRKLDSAVVGTPGIDTSGQKIGQAVASAAGGVAQTATTIAVQRRQAMDQAVAFEESLKYEAKASKIEQKHRAQYATFDGPPVERADVLKDQLTELRNSMADALKTDGAKQDFLTKSGTHLQSRYRDELKAADENQVFIAGDRVVKSNNMIATSVYEKFKSPTLTYDEKIQELKYAEQKRFENLQKASPILGPEKTEKFNKDTSQGIVKASVLGLIEADPVSATKFLKDPAVKEILGPEEHAKWLEKAKDRALNFKDVVKQRQFEVVAETNSAEIEKFYNGQHDLGSIQNIKDPKTRELLTNAYLDTKQLTAEEIVEREAELLIRWEDFFEKDRDGNLTSNLRKDVKPEDVVELQQEYMESFKITRSQAGLVKAAKAYPDMLSQSIKNQQPSPILKAFVSGLRAFGVVGQAIAAAVEPKKKKIDVAAAKERSQMANVFFEKLSQINVDDPEQVQNAMRSTIQAHQSKTNPNRAKYLIGEIVPTPMGSGKVVGYDDDGEPILELK